MQNTFIVFMDDYNVSKKILSLISHVDQFLDLLKQPINLWVSESDRLRVEKLQ